MMPQTVLAWPAAHVSSNQNGQHLFCLFTTVFTAKGKKKLYAACCNDKRPKLSDLVLFHKSFRLDPAGQRFVNTRQFLAILLHRISMEGLPDPFFPTQAQDKSGLAP